MPMMTIDQYRKAYPQFNQMSDEELTSKLFAKYGNGQDLDAFATHFNGGRTWGEFAQDQAVNVAQSGVGLVNMIAGAGATLGIPGADTMVEATNYARDEMGKRFHSESLQRKQAELSQAVEGKNDDETDKAFFENASDVLGFVAENPAMLADLTMQNIGSLVGGAAVGIATKGSALALGAYQTLLGAGDGYSSAQERILQMKPEDLAQNSKVFRELLEQGLTIDEAQRQVADDAAQKSGYMTGAISGVLAKFGGVALEKQLGEAANQIGARVTAGMAGKAMGKEVATEFGEEAGVQLSGNVAIKYDDVNPEQGLMQGVGGSGALGAAASVTPSGVMGGANMYMTRNLPTQAELDAKLKAEEEANLLAEKQAAEKLLLDEALPDSADPLNVVSKTELNRTHDLEAQTFAQKQTELSKRLESQLAPEVSQANDVLDRMMPMDPELQDLAARGVPVVEITPEQSVAQLAEQPQIKMYGDKPFQTEQSAKISQAYKTTPNAVVIPVDGGYGVVDDVKWKASQQAQYQPKPYPIKQVLDRAIDTQKQVEIEAAYRKRDNKLDRQKELDYVEAQLQALEQQNNNLIKLQSETPIENTALRSQLTAAIKQVETKKAAQEAIRQEIMATGNPRLVEAGIEEMQGVEVPELPMAITPDLAESYAPNLPENFADERLLDEAYRVVLGEVFDNTTKGGGVSLMPVAGTGYTGGDGNEYGQQMTRTKSMNHPITQALIADGYTAEEVKAALDASLKGQKLGKRWQGLVAKALDYSNTDAADIRASMAEFEQAKAAEITPDALGYGDTINAPFAPDNAQPVTLNDQAQPRGADDAVKFSRGGNVAGIVFNGQSKKPTGDIFLNERVVLPRQITAKTDAMLESGELLDMSQVEVPVASIVPTQAFISSANMGKIKKSTNDTNAELVKVDDKYYVLDGHHRIAARIAAGDVSIKAHVVDLSDSSVKYSFAGRKAKTANLDNLANAEARIAAGEDAETVRQETGWHQGVDGKWRFEIDDSVAKLKVNVLNADEVNEHQTKIDSLKNTLAGILARDDLTNIEKQRAKSNADVRLKMLEQAAPIKKIERALTKRVRTIGELLDHPELLSAYPSVGEIKVAYSDDAIGRKQEKGEYGSYNPETNEIRLNVNLDEKEILSTLMHEIQHAIQEEENFARGGSPDEFVDEKDNMLEMYRKQASNAFSWLDENWKKIAATIASGNDVDGSIQAFVDSEANQTTKDSIKKYVQAINAFFNVENSNDFPTAEEQYRALAGEVEARNTQSRLGMNAQERKLTAPWSTQDVPNDKQIARFDGGRADMAVSQAQFGRTGNKPNDFITADGSIDFWIVPEFTNNKTAAEYPSKPVRLKVGAQYGNHNGFGEKHIAEQRKKFLNDIGMSAERYVHSLLNSAYRIYAEGNGVLQVEAYGEPKGKVVVELRDEGDYYSVVTAYDTPKKHGSLIWSGRRPVVSFEQNAVSSKVRNSNESSPPLVGSLEKPSPLNGTQGFVNQDPALDALGANRNKQNTTTTNLTKQQATDIISRDADGKRLLSRGKVKVLGSIDEAPAHVLEQAKRSEVASDTIMVDGVERSTRNSNGQLIHPTKQGIENFWRWFGDSKVVDSNGRPLVVYHGTDADFDEFRTKNRKATVALSDGETIDYVQEYGGIYGEGAYFIDRSEYASAHAYNGSIIPAYLNLKNPQDAKSYKRQTRKTKEKHGFDGVSMGGEYVAFHPNQIKSAIGNNGDFDPENKNILYSQDGNIQGFFDPVTDTTYLVADALTADTINGVLVHEVGVHAWWAKANSDKKAALEKRAMQLLNQGKYGNEKIKAFYAAVEQRMIDADVQGNAEEAAAYIVEEAINQAGADKSKLSDSRLIDWVAKNISQSLANFLSDFISSVRASMHRIGWLKTANLTGADLVAIAKRNMREVATSEGVENTQNNAGNYAGVLASMASDTPTQAEIVQAQRYLDTQLAIADKLEAEYGYLPAPNGEKSNLNKQQWAQVRTPQFKEFYGDWEKEQRRNDTMAGQSVEPNARTKGASGSRSANGLSGGVAPSSRVGGVLQLVREEVRLDSNGEPKVYYHGTSDDVSAFDTNHKNRKDKGWLGRGVYATDARSLAAMYARQKQGEAEQNVMPLFVGVKNPYLADKSIKNKLKFASQEGIDSFTQELLSNGYDGVAIKFPNGEIELVAFNPNAVKSAIGNVGTFSGKTGKINFSKAGTTQPKSAFTVPEFTIARKAQQKLQDNFNRIKQIQDAITEQGGKVAPTSDVYKAEERFWGKVGSRASEFQHAVKKLIGSISESNIDLGDMEEYLYARHAGERNTYIRTNVDANNLAGSGMTDAQAAQIMQKMEAKHKGIDKLANRFDAMIAETRKIQYESGLIGLDTFNKWSEYKHYVPLKGFADDDLAAEFAQSRLPVGKGFDVRGTESKKAGGRTTLAAQLIENMYQQRLQAIARAGKNEVTAALFNLVNDNPNSDLWEINAIARSKSSKEGVAFLRFATQQERDDYLVNMGISNAKIDFDGNVYTAEFAAPVGVINKYLEQKDTVATKIGGKTVYIKIKDEVLLDQLKREDLMGGLGPLEIAIAMQNMLKRFYTSLNPEFTAINFMRDLMTAFVAMPGETGKFVDSAKFVKNLTVIGSAVKYAYGKQDANLTPEMKDLVNRYLENGGSTGFMDFKDIGMVSDSINKMWLDARMAKDAGLMDKAKTMSRLAWDKTAGNIERANEGLEMATRLAAFKTAIDSGKTDREAAAIAKNITVNFNRKGDWARGMDLSFMFFNPAIQGTVRVLEIASKPKSAAMLGGLIALGLFTALVSGGDDDEEGNSKWDLIPDENKMKTLPFLGLAVNGGFGQIQMPYGVNFFTSIGYALGDVYRWYDSNGKRGKSPDEAAEFTAKAMATHLNAFGGMQIFEGGLATVQAVTPAMLDPVVQVGGNVSWTGKALRPEDMFNKGKNDATPDSQKFFAGQEDNPETRIVGWLSRTTGGDGVKAGLIEIAPSTLNATMQAAFGGVWSMGKATYSAIGKAANPNEAVEAKDIPIVRKMVGGVTSGMYSAAYREKADEVKGLMSQYDNYIKDGRFAEARAFYNENVNELEDAGKVKAYDKQLKSLRTQRNMIFDNRTLTDAERQKRLTENKKKVEEVLKKAVKAVE